MCLCVADTACFQAYAAEAGPEAAQQPIEEAGMSEEVIQKVSWSQCVEWACWAGRWIFAVI